MKVYESNFAYDYSFPTVTLAYFLRYPNPYSKHVLSTDVIDRHLDPETGRLHTTRLVLKRSKVPSAMLKLLPKGLAGPGGASQSLIIEKSTVDIKEGWMKTESRNMEWTGILSVVENQTFKRQPADVPPPNKKWLPVSPLLQEKDNGSEWTGCNTTVTFVSRLGQSKMKKNATKEDAEPPRGFLSAWSTSGLQRTIERIGVMRTRDALVNGKNGMNMVLERLRSGGIVAALEGMRHDREMGLTPA